MREEEEEEGEGEAWRDKEGEGWRKEVRENSLIIKKENFSADTTELRKQKYAEGAA